MLLGDKVVEVPEGVPVGSGFLGPVCGKGGGGQDGVNIVYLSMTDCEV